MVKGLLAHTGGLFWNLSADVGPGQPNLPDDVELVRFGYFLMKDNPKVTNGPFAAIKPVLQQVTPSGAFDSDSQQRSGPIKASGAAPRMAGSASQRTINSIEANTTANTSGWFFR